MLGLRSSISRTTSRFVATSKRNMGGHAPPPTDGLDGIVRKYLPGNHHLALGVMGFYGSLYLISKLFSGGKKKAVADAHGTADHHAAKSEDKDAMPSLDSASFGEWLSGEGNFEKMLTTSA